ncbi:YbaY family lipoprotein [Desulforhabdus amnigena]|jgi:putative lipoprotein|uniref:Lipocalin-like domain-containing protein n=1 Tax=Desulforhabdus amnigena TaxID=40218 RepID=A0A9W6L9T7_9BACT|nr:YbaY family lipoprotein [Desulforhabdus amnigena]NLJ28089.1 hypothetical protein [Deltaproteobacteria bacterium]GLI35520.1 hypothetical protein DAMNIGENAA_29530 [Desulforhabdus amnigena]
MKNVWIFGVILLNFIAGCAVSKMAPGPPEIPIAKEAEVKDRNQLLVGIWTREIRDGVKGTEGLNIRKDGALELVNIYSLRGLNWRRDGETLVLTTNTEKYPEPYESRFKIEELTDSVLTLSAPEDYLAGTYSRQRGMGRQSERGKVAGTVTFSQRTVLPPQAVLQVSLVDVTRREVPAVPIGTQTVAHTRHVPISFEVSYDPADIQPNHRYEIEARITVGGKTLFTNTSPHPVLTQGNPDTVEVVVESGVSP